MKGLGYYLTAYLTWRISLMKNSAFEMRRFLASLLILTSFTISSYASMNATTLVQQSAKRYGVPEELALAVAKHESGIRCGVVGSHGEVGPLQILPATARGLGFGNIRHQGCAAQTDAGMAHLARCYRGMGGNRWATAVCHNQGFSAITGSMTARAKRYANAVMGLPGKPVKKKTYRKRYTSNFGAS